MKIGVKTVLIKVDKVNSKAISHRMASSVSPRFLHPLPEQESQSPSQEADAKPFFLIVCAGQPRWDATGSAAPWAEGGAYWSQTDVTH